MGLVPMSPKLRSGELYLLFKKLPNIECAQKMIATRPEFEAGEFTATVVAPLEQAAFEPDVVIFTLWPEQAMWLCCASTYDSGERQIFHTSGYNSTCADLTVQVMKSQKMNISFGCYGARASSDIEDFEVYLSVPYGQMERLVKSVAKLAAKSIPEARRRIYMPPVMDNVACPGQETVEKVTIRINEDRCNGCGLCEAFCPESVLGVTDVNGDMKAQVSIDEKCCVCYTCVGQCPQKAIQIEPNTIP
jgi:ferredoxin